MGISLTKRGNKIGMAIPKIIWTLAVCLSTLLFWTGNSLAALSANFTYTADGNDPLNIQFTDASTPGD